jgi:hypothetical protein
MARSGTYPVNYVSKHGRVSIQAGQGWFDLYFGRYVGRRRFQWLFFQWRSRSLERRHREEIDAYLAQRRTDQEAS